MFEHTQEIRPLISGNHKNVDIDYYEIYYLKSLHNEWKMMSDNSFEYKIHIYSTDNKDIMLKLIIEKFAFNVTSDIDDKGTITYTFSTICKY